MSHEHDHHEPADHADQNTAGETHNCQHHHGEQPMCSCDHNPGGECHCPPNECKCDQIHHIEGRTQTDHSCCKDPNSHRVSHHDAHHHDEHAAHDHSGLVAHDHSGLVAHDHSGHDHSGHGSHDHSGHSGHDHSHHDPNAFRKQFWFALALTIPTILYSHTLQMLLGFSMPEFVGSQYLPAVLGLILLLTGGRVFLKSGYQEIKAKQPGMMALISMALFVAAGYSTFLTIAQAIGLGFEGMDFWWELAALITIMLLGHWIEMRSIMRAQNALGALAGLLPDTAELIEADGSELKVRVNQLKAGDLVLVRAGASIPADGVVVEGNSSVDESMVTGESRAVSKQAGDSVIGGTINAVAERVGLGALKIRVTAVGDDSMLANISRLVAEAQESKSKTQRLADRAAGWLFYLATLAAVLTAAIWSLIGGQNPDFVLERVVTVLIIACPHALGLAIPLVTSITTALAARNGILIRDRIAFESLRKAQVVVFDKTGTLTTGEREVVGVHLSENSPLASGDELVALAAGIEIGSEHALGKAILHEAAKRNVTPVEVRDQMTTPGLGVSGRFEGSKVSAGGPGLVTQSNAPTHVNDVLAASHANEAGQTVIFVVRDQTLLGMIAIGDAIREQAKPAVEELKGLGKQVVMLTGDANGVAQSVAKQLGIDEVYAEVLPHHKRDVVDRFKAAGKTVVMVGDGVNDAPALALADVGIALGAGTDVAIESAAVVLVSNDPTAVGRAVSLSKRTYSKMVQNLWWAAGYNILAIPMAAGALAPIGLVLTPAVGAVLMSLSTIIVAANAQLLRRQAV